MFGIATKATIVLSFLQFYKMLWLWFYDDFFLNLGFCYNDVEPGFLTGGTCTPWGYKTPKQGVRGEASE